MLALVYTFGTQSPPMVSEERTARIAVRATPQELAMLHQLAEAEGISASDYIRMFVRQRWAEKHGTKKPKP